MMPLDFLRNLKLNDAFAPQWEQPEHQAPGVIVPQGNTNFDPFQGTRWGQFFDTLDADSPGGAKMAMSGLKSAVPPPGGPPLPPKSLPSGQGQASAEQAGAFQRYLRGGQ